MKNSKSISIDSKESKKEIQSIESKLDQSNSNDSLKDSKGDGFQSDLYSFNPSKRERSKLRSKRDRLIKSIMKSNEDKNIEDRNSKIENFKEFYKKNYLKNDYSHDSISRSNHPSSREFIEDFLSHLKRWKIEL